MPHVVAATARASSLATEDVNGVDAIPVRHTEVERRPLHDVEESAIHRLIGEQPGGRGDVRAAVVAGARGLNDDSLNPDDPRDPVY